jgi:hypothetical protein
LHSDHLDFLQEHYVKFTKRTIAGAAAGFVLAGGAAFAAALIFADGSISQAAANPTLNVGNDAHFTNTLVPGGTAGAAVSVGNPNDFAVKVVKVGVKTSGLSVTGAGCNINTLTLNGSPETINGSATQAFAIAAPVEIPAGGVATVTVPGVVTQAGSATAFCGVHADFTVVGSVGN